MTDAQSPFALCYAASSHRLYGDSVPLPVPCVCVWPSPPYYSSLAIADKRYADQSVITCVIKLMAKNERAETNEPVHGSILCIASLSPS